MIYLDNAATSWPKPEEVYQAADEALRRGGNPGRSGHKLSISAGRMVEESRMLLAKLFAIPNPESIAFTLNTTDALNLAIKGMIKKDDHVITSSMEHNSVARPLEALKSSGVEMSKVASSPISGVDIREVKAAIKGNTRLMVFSHVSNVTGTINPVAEIGQLCHEYGIIFLVDAAQSAGVIPIDVMRMNIDLLAFPGHKSLLGPVGTGGLYVREGLSLKPLREGGTGSFSELLSQPEKIPDRYESGTLNTSGIAGLAAGVRFLLEQGVETLQEKEAALTNRLLKGISQIPGITVFGPPPGKLRTGVVSLVIDGMEPAQTAIILDNIFDIAVRAGLHCAPDAHRTLGTIGTGGTVRFSIGAFNTEKEIDLCLVALRSIAQECGLWEVRQ
jgi:cysteine desulfurase family protein